MLLCGETDIKVAYINDSYLHKFFVVNDNSVTLLGRDLCSKLNISIVVPDSSNNTLNNNYQVNATDSPIAKKYELCLSDDYKSNVIVTVNLKKLPNQELSGAKSELPGEMVGVCSFHRRCGHLPYKLPITHLRFTPRSLQVCLLVYFNK